MKKFTQTIDEIKYGFTPGEFLPIFVEGRLANKPEFIKYKIKCFIVKKTLA